MTARVRDENGCFVGQRSSAEAVTAVSGMRRCPRCKIRKPLNLSHWYVVAASADGFDGQCKLCRNQRKRERRLKSRLARQRLEREQAALPPLEPGKICPVCCGLAHRVSGLRCWRCKLDDQAEAPVELVFRKAV